MVEIPNKQPFLLRGRRAFQAQNLARLLKAMLLVAVRRLRHGSSIPGASWQTESGIYFFREQFVIAGRFKELQDGRDYLDSILFPVPALEQVRVEYVDDAVKGAWFTPPKLAGELPVLFFPGGGYIFEPLSTAALHATIALVTGRRLFTASYPLAPEFTFPAQLEAAERAYWWMADNLAIPPESMIVGGASAGGNLCLALLLKLRDAAQPLPALACLLSPWVDLGNSGRSMTGNTGADWITLETCQRSAPLYCGEESAGNPLISPLFADLRGLPSLYIQAGGQEIFIDMIRAFANQVDEDGVDVRLDVWEKMIHTFQAFYGQLHESKEALVVLGEVINQAAGKSSIGDHQTATQEDRRLFV